MFFNKKNENDQIENKILAELKALTVDIINSKKNANYNMALNIIPALYTLYGRNIKVDCKNPKWINRDRVIVSPLVIPALISTLYMSGFDISLDSLKDKDDSFQYTSMPGVDAVINRNSEMLPTAIGIAVGEKYLHDLYKTRGKNIFDFYTYLFCSNLDFIEGTGYESLRYISKAKVNKLIILYDSSNIFSTTSDLIDDPIKYFESFNFNVLNVDGNNLSEIDNCITKAKSSDKTTVIILNHNDNENYFESNCVDCDYLLTEEEITKYKNKLGVRDISYTVSSDTVSELKGYITNRVDDEVTEWNKMYDSLSDIDKNILNKIAANDMGINDNSITCSFDENDSLIEVANKILNSISDNNPLFYGKLLDLNYSESVSSIQNGLSLVGIRNFSMYNMSKIYKIIPSVLCSAEMNLPNTYIIYENNTNSDSLIYLRSISNVLVFRPNDVNEMIGAFQVAMSTNDSPCCIIIGSGKTFTKGITSINDTKKGAYIVKKEDKNISCILISNGNDLDIAIDVSDTLVSKGYDIRVVSMPSIEQFKAQNNKYKDDILPLGTKVFVIENSSSYSWYQFVYNEKYLITSDLINWDFDINILKDRIIAKIENLIK